MRARFRSSVRSIKGFKGGGGLTGMQVIHSKQSTEHAAQAIGAAKISTLTVRRAAPQAAPLHLPAA
jgi:hypothetical protein